MHAAVGILVGEVFNPFFDGTITGPGVVCQAVEGINSLRSREVETEEGVGLDKGSEGACLGKAT